MFKKILFIFIILLCFDFKIDQQIFIKWSKEKEINKRKYQEFLLKKINLEIQKKSGKKQ